jgi:hypothetical protein
MALTIDGSLQRGRTTKVFSLKTTTQQKTLCCYSGMVLLNNLTAIQFLQIPTYRYLYTI